MWESRALLDVGRAELIREAQEQADGGQETVRPGLFVRCNFCNIALPLNQLCRKAGMAKNSFLSRQKPVLSCCPSCRQPLPKCYICLLPLGSINRRDSTSPLPLRLTAATAVATASLGHSRHLHCFARPQPSPSPPPPHSRCGRHRHRNRNRHRLRRLRHRHRHSLLRVEAPPESPGRGRRCDASQCSRGLRYEHAPLF
jgi:hypothetical protein